MNQGSFKKAKDALLRDGESPEKGLTSQEAANRLATYGPNNLIEEQDIRFFKILRTEFTEPMILLLIVVGVLYSVWGTLTDALTIIAIITILVLVEVWNEYRAEHSIDALKKLSSPTSKVLRDSRPMEVLSSQIVLQDILLLKPGERVPADAVLMDAVGLEVDEASLTGESFPVFKEAIKTMDMQQFVDYKNMVYAGTVIVKGRAKALVSATGLNTELGKVVGMTKAAKEPKTPLQIAMKQLSKTLVLIALFFSILVPVLGFFRGLSLEQSILYGLSLSFATIPEELPIIITMVLGVGAYSLSRKNALVKRLRATETLGNTTIIATDKTGTITENKMRVESLYFDGRIVKKQDFGSNEKESLKTGLFASDAIKAITSDSVLGNPMADAILEVVKENISDLGKLQEIWILKDEKSFDSKRKLASYVYQLGASTIILSSGAPENVLANSVKLLLQGQEIPITDELRKKIKTSISEMAQAGQRLLAFGYYRITPIQTQAKLLLEQNLILVGVIGFIDPPRKEVKGAIHYCQEAGIKVVMVTGDHPETAKAIAAQVGIPNNKVITGKEIDQMNDQQVRKMLRDTSIFARTTPENKLRLVRLMRENGEIVAVTGDGVNDAPALKEAHIGIAMGIRGTDVAKEAADMVLADDNFVTIQTSIREGRKIFSNLRKGVRYYLACKVALIAIFILPLALNVPLPFAPIQIIVLELFMDLAALATFVAEPEEAGLMKKPPINPKEKFLNLPMQLGILKGAMCLFVAVSVNYLITYYSTQNLAQAQTMAFVTWMISHIFLALNFRSEKQPLIKLGVMSNKIMLLWAIVVVVTLAVGTNLLGVHELLKITNLSLSDWMLAIGVSFLATFWIEYKKIRSAKSIGVY